MSVYFIRHAKVKFEFDKKYNSSQYIDAVKNYDLSNIVDIEQKTIEEIKSKIPNQFTVFISSMKRSQMTAEKIFPEINKIVIKELDEILLYPYKQTNKQIALENWVKYGKIQWFLNFKNQIRNRKIVKQEIAKILEKINIYPNSVIIGHQIQLKYMLKEMIKNGFYAMNHSLKEIDNLEVIEYKRCPTTAST